MKKEELIILNEVEYTAELNRDSFLKIDEYCNFQETNKIVNKQFYEYKDEIKEDEDPFKNTISDEKIDEIVEEKEKALNKIICRAFWIWLYPNHKLGIKQIEEILSPYFDDDEKFNYLVEQYEKLLKESVEVKQQHDEQRKNLKAQANK